MFRKLPYYGSSFLLGLIFFTAGMAKLYAGHAFPGLIGPVWLEERLEAYDLGSFARFIAFAQIVIGFILLTLRYITLGAIMLLPMLLNILIVTISLHWRGTPYVILFFLLLNIYLLVHDRRWVLPLVTGRPVEIDRSRQQGFHFYGHIIWLLGLVITLSAVPISGFNGTFGYIFVLSGVLMAWLSPAADRMSRGETT